MKTRRIQTHGLIIVPLLILCQFLSITGYAQKPQKGNGNITTKKVVIDQFWNVELQTYCNVVIECGRMPLVEFTIDENLRDHIDITVKDGTLYLSTEDWIQASQITLKVQVPFIKSFKQSGWGDITINNLETENFSLIARTGTVKINGKVDSFTIEGGPGDINARELYAENVTIKKVGWGDIDVYAGEKLEVFGEYATIEYLGEPEIIITQPDAESLSVIRYNPNKEIPDINYITLKVRNNSSKKKDFYIEGPGQQRFSYGFPMQAYFVRKKNVPVGTKIYEQKLVGRKLLLEIKAEDEGRTLDLFTEN